MKEKGYTYHDSFGGTYEIFPALNMYADNNNLYLGFDFIDKECNAMLPYCDATVNVGVLPYLESAIDTNNNGNKIISFLVENGFGEPTGQAIPSGFCAFPVVKFNADKLQEIDPALFAEYSKLHGISLDRGISPEKTSLVNRIQSAQTKADKAPNDVDTYKKETER